jgi:hypothetical protein
MGVGVRPHDGFRGGHGVDLAISVDGVGFDQILLAGGRRIVAVLGVALVFTIFRGDVRLT